MTRWWRRRGPDADVDPYVRDLYDTSRPLPPGAAEELADDSPRLAELRARYAALDWPVCRHTRWSPTPAPFLDLRYFRGDNLYVWHYRETERVSRLKYFIFLEYVRARDELGLLDRLGEDGLFGCWTFEFEGRPRCSRDLLDSVNELLFLDRHLALLAEGGRRVLDIGAGYGRLAHRVAQCATVADYCCVDAVPESTFLCEYYTRFRGVAPPVRVVELPQVPSVAPGTFDVAINVHSFSECTRDAVAWWMVQLDRLAVPHLFVVPNEAEGFLTIEADGTRLDYGDLLDARYRLVAEEPAFADPAVREVLGVDDRYCLFERR